MDYGMVTAVGLNAQQTAASVRAGLDRFFESSILGKSFRPLIMSVLPDAVLSPLHPDVGKVGGLTSRQSRMLRLAAPALQEAVKRCPEVSAIPLFLGTPEQWPNRPEPVGEGFLQQLAVQSGVDFAVSASRVFAEGRAAGLVALNAALDFISSGQGECAIVGGVDSYLDLYLLGTLDMQDRVNAPGVMDGFIPGEGAAFIVVTAANSSEPTSFPPRAAIKGAVVGHEEGHLYSDIPYLGEGLASAFTSFFFGKGNVGQVRELYSAVNGENHWAKELGVALTRNSGFFASDCRTHHPADCYGDLGAASGIAQIILACEGIGRGYRGSPILVSCSSDYGCRAVAGVSRV